jgi:Cdc6-like AAA superfamily ATPase
MSRNTVKVCIRTRPTQNFAQDNLFIDVEHSTIMVKHTDPNAETSVLNNRQNTFKFRFDHVFHNASQSAVYDLYARDTVHDVVYGINGAILTYGQTGSGKTFTMVNTIIIIFLNISPLSLLILYIDRLEMQQVMNIVELHHVLLHNYFKKLIHVLN